MSPLPSHQVQQWRILSELESGGAVSQRALARKLGIALGRTNQLVRELTDRRLISCAGGRSAPSKYQLTRAGRRQQAHVARARMDDLVDAYAETRQRILERFRALEASGRGDGTKRVVFYDDGRGVSELGWICLHGTALRLVGIVGDSAGSLCNLPVQGWDRLRGQELAGEAFDRLVVMSFGPVSAIRARLRQCGVPRGVPFWV